MGAPFSTDRSRMEAIKQIFYGFRDRVESANLGHELGLLQFDSEVERLLAPTSDLAAFEEHIDRMAKRGATAIFSAVVEAAAMLAPAREAGGADAELRIVVLSDGQSNNGVPADRALEAAWALGATVDAIIVGPAADLNLRKICAATGGEVYQIHDLAEGFELFEAEAVVSLVARRGGAPKPPRPPQPPSLASIPLSKVTGGGAVERVAVVPRRASTRVVAAAALPHHDAAAASTKRGLRGGTAKRVLTELMQVAKGDESVWLHSGEGVHLFPAEDDLTYMRALIEGPAGSPFAGGVFSLGVSILSDYPESPPTIGFETPIYHCNVSDAGAICLDLLREKWSPSLTVPKLLEAIRFLMAAPNPDDALRQYLAELTISAAKSGGVDSRYADEARRRTAKDAGLSIEEWRQKWKC